MFKIHNSALSKHAEQLRIAHLLETLRKKQQMKTTMKIRNKILVQNAVRESKELQEVEELNENKKKIKMQQLKVTKTESICSDEMSLMLEKYKILKAEENYKKEMLLKVNKCFSGISIKPAQEPSQMMIDIINSLK
jgi:hypothetical protein